MGRRGWGSNYAQTYCFNLALLYKVLLCGLAWLTDFLEIQSTNNLRVIFAAEDAKYWKKNQILCTYVIFSCLNTKNLKKYNSWPLCYGNMGCFWAGYDLNKVYHIWYNYGFWQICSGKKNSLLLWFVAFILYTRSRGWYRLFSTSVYQFWAH